MASKAWPRERVNPVAGNLAAAGNVCTEDLAFILLSFIYVTLSRAMRYRIESGVNGVRHINPASAAGPTVCQRSLIRHSWRALCGRIGQAYGFCKRRHALFEFL